MEQKKARISGRHSIHGEPPRLAQKSENNDPQVASKTHETDDQHESDIHSSQESLNQEHRLENGFSKNVAPEYTPESAELSPPKYTPEPAKLSPPKYTPESAKLSPPTSGSSIDLGWWFAIAVIVLVCAYVVFPQTPKVKQCSFAELRHRYPTQGDHVWINLKVGIEDILNERSKTPGVYLFAHPGGEHLRDLVREIAEESSSCFGQKRQAVELNTKDFLFKDDDNDYGHIIEKFKAKLKDGKVILIANLNEIPSRAARALHTICDTYSPIAKDVVIFLTLVVEGGDSEISLQKTLDTLHEMWAPELDDNELEPLITRVTDQVIVLH